MDRLIYTQIAKDTFSRLPYVCIWRKLSYVVLSPLVIPAATSACCRFLRIYVNTLPRLFQSRACSHGPAKGEGQPGEDVRQELERSGQVHVQHLVPITLLCLCYSGESGTTRTKKANTSQPVLRRSSRSCDSTTSQ